MDGGRLIPHSLTIATDIAVLPDEREVIRRGDHLVVRCPGNPEHWWGNFLVFDRPPAAGDGAGWETAFDAAFAGEPRIVHRALTWDVVADADYHAAGLYESLGFRATERTVTLDRAARDPVAAVAK